MAVPTFEQSLLMDDDDAGKSPCANRNGLTSEHTRRVSALRGRDVGHVNGTHSPTPLVSPIPKRTQSFEMASPALWRSFSQSAKSQMTDQSQITRPPSPKTASRIPVYPAIPAPASLNATRETQDVLSNAPPLGRSPRLTKPLSHQHLSTIAERKPLTYQPTSAPTRGTPFLPRMPFENRGTVSEFPMTEWAHNAASSISDSIASPQGPGVIHIKPSNRLQSMQAVGDMGETRNQSPCGAWTRSNMFMSQSQVSLPKSLYVPTGTPQSVADAIGHADERIFEDPRPAPSPPQMLESTQGAKDWTRARDWAEPTHVVESSNEWIEGFLVRRAEADRQEDAAQRKQEKSQRWDLARVDSLKQVNKVIRRLSNSGKKAGGFEARQERQDKKSSAVSYGQSAAQQRTPGHGQRPAKPTKIQPDIKQYSVDQALPTSTTTPTATTKPEQPTLKRRFHTVSGASIHRFLLRKMSFRRTDPQGEELGVGRSISVNIGRKASVRAKGIAAKFERLGKKGTNESSRKDSAIHSKGGKGACTR